MHSVSNNFRLILIDSGLYMAIHKLPIIMFIDAKLQCPIPQLQLRLERAVNIILVPYIRQLHFR